MTEGEFISMLKKSRPDCFEAGVKLKWNRGSLEAFARECYRIGFKAGKESEPVSFFEQIFGKERG